MSAREGHTTPSINGVFPAAFCHVGTRARKPQRVSNGDLPRPRHTRQAHRTTLQVTHKSVEPLIERGGRRRRFSCVRAPGEPSPTFIIHVQH